MVIRLKPTPYAATRLNDTTFLIIHEDIYSEYPFIYAKLFRDVPVLLLIDTGCGKSASAFPDSVFNDLREFIEECPVEDNDQCPLNPAFDDQGRAMKQRDYLVATTHVHYDHIGGIESFDVSNSTCVVASGFDRSFNSNYARRKNSLCDSVGMELPKYSIAKFLEEGEQLCWPMFADKPGKKLGITAILTPGHTPDSLTLYDEEESWLFTGDTFYLRKCFLPDKTAFRQPIMFDVASDWKQFVASVTKLKHFVRGENDKLSKRTAGKQIMIACAHTTSAAPAAKLLDDVEMYFVRVAAGDVPKREHHVKNGVCWMIWQDRGDPEFSLLSPEQIVPVASSGCT